MAKKCKIIYNQQGQKIAVEQIESDKPSQIFQDILNNPHIKNFDESLEIYKNVYSKDIKFSIIGEKGAQNLDNIEEVTFRLDNLKVAKEMQDKGKTPLEIRLITGWELNRADNKWRFEIQDGTFNELKVDFTEQNELFEDKVAVFTLQDLYNNEQLYKAYPELKITNVTIFETDNKLYDSSTMFVYKKQIYINKKYYGVKGNRFSVSNGTRRIFGHEIQHLLQDIEGFGRGTSTSRNKLKIKESIEYVKFSNEKSIPRTESEIEFDKFFKSFILKTQEAGTWEEIITGSIPVEFVSDFLANIIYKSYAGEVEARNVEKRFDYSPTERLNTLLEVTQDIPFEDQFVDINKNLQSQTREPQLKYQTQKGNTFNLFAQALRSTNGGDIKVGLKTLKGFKDLYSISSNTNVDTQQGLINHLIKAEVLSGVSYKENGKTHLIPEGKNYVKKLLNGESIKDAFKKQLGIKSAKLKKDGSIQIDQDLQRDRVTVKNNKGEQVVVKLSELNAPFEELKKKFDSETIAISMASDLVASEISKSNQIIDEEFVPENILQEKLISLIRKFGITTMAFDEYVKKFPMRNGMPIDAQALADLAERIIAFKDGVVDSDDLVEEVSHLIEASMPFEQKENILRNIHKTKEWGEFAKQYEGVYETDLELRREILGKVIANAIKEQFAQRESNQTENAIIAKIREFIEQFINNLRTYFQESYITELDNINKDIFEKLFAETLDLNLEGKTGIFFSTQTASFNSKRAVKVTSDALEAIRLQQSKLNKKYNNSSDRTYLEQSKKLIMEEEDAYILDGISKFARLVSAQANRLLSQSEKKQSGEFPLSAEENTIYQNLKNNVEGALLELDTILNEKQRNPKDRNLVKEAIRADLQKTVQTLNAVKTAIEINTPLAIDRIVEDFLKRYDMYEDNGDLTKEGEEYKKLMTKAVAGNLRDTDIVHTYLGSMAQAQNPLLGIAGNIIKRMKQQENDDYQKSWKTYINKFTALKGTQKDLEKLIDKNTNSLHTEVDQVKAENILKAIKDEVEAGIISKEKLGFKTLDEYYENEKDLVEIDRIKDEFFKRFNVEKAKRLVPYYEPKYQEARDAHIFEINYVDSEGKTKKQILNPNGETIVIDRQYKSQIGEIKKNAINDVLTVEDNFRIKEISLRRAEEENPRDTTTGEFIKGVTEVYDSSKKRYFVVRSNEQNLLPADEQRVNTIVGLNAIRYKNQDFISKQEGNKEFPEKFIKDLQDLKTIEEKLEFVKNNSYISYPDEYFNTLTENDSLIDKLRNLGTKDALKKLEEIKAKKAVIANIIKANAVRNSPGEVDFIQITDTQTNSIKLQQSSLDNAYKKARDLLKEDNKTQSIGAVTRVTDAYLAHLEDSGITTLNEEIDFILTQTTREKALKIDKARAMVNGEEAISKGFRNVFTEGMSKSEMESTLLDYARARLLPHLKKTEPQSYTDAYNDVLSGKLAVEDWVRKSDVVKVSPSFSFYTNQSNINPKWVENKKNNKEQWTQEYLDQVKNANFDAIKADKRLMAIRDAILEYNDYQIENVNLTGVQSRYQMPFIRQTLTQRGLNMPSVGVKETVKESLKDFTSFREEEQELMPHLNNGLYTIPVYYNRPLDNPKEQSTDYTYNLAMWGQHATEHKYRRENISDMLVIDETLKNISTKNKNAYTMFKSSMEYNFYGKQEAFSHKIMGVDVGKVLKVVNNVTKRYNIAGISVPITSALQASVAKNMERVIGETIDSESSNIGNSYFARFASSSARESMGFSSNSIPNVIGEAFGYYSITHRYENSQLNKAGRLFVNLSSKLHEVGNFPVIQRAVFGIIASYRYSDGKLIHYSKFVQKMQAQGFKGNIKAEWKKQPLFIDDFLLAIENGVLDFKNPKFVKVVESKLTGVKSEDLEKYLYDKKLDIGTRVTSFINRIDSQIPNDERNIVQRHGVANFFFSHLGWLPTAIQRRVKHRHFNQSEDGVPQEGSWRTAGEFVAKIAKSPKDFSKIYADLDFGQKKNLKRVMIEIGYANALAMLGLLMSGMDDEDEERNFAVAFGDYFLNRVAVEQISGTLGIPTSIYSVVDQPLMLATKMKQWAQVSDLTGTNEDRFKYLGAFTGYLRDYTKFQDLTKARQSYLYFNNEKKNLYDIYAPLTLLMSKEE